MIELCEKRLDWCVLLVLVGEGQEIHNGENSGIIQWNTALEKAETEWEIICPDKLVGFFPDKRVIDNKNRSALNLSMSLRTHLAGDVSKFASALVDGDIDMAKALSGEIIQHGFSMYVTRNLTHAKRYLKERYRDEPSKRFGMIASSKGKILRQHGMDNSFYGALGMFGVGKWFNEVADHPKSCCALDVVATEFSCQGLELDMPLIGWDNDMLWNGSEWEKFKKSEPEESDANTYRKNSYRVLLTRGRDGFVIYVPPVEEMDMTYHIHMLVEIPPNQRVSDFMGYLKGKSTMIIFERFSNLKYKYGNRHFWCRGYYVSTVGGNKEGIAKYIREQEHED